MTREKIMFYALHWAGLSEPMEFLTCARVGILVNAGFLERREKTVTIPAVHPAFADHHRGLGLDPTEHVATLVTYHATDAGRVAFANGDL